MRWVARAASPWAGDMLKVRVVAEVKVEVVRAMERVREEKRMVDAVELL